jgi:hypothetical protein
MSTCTLSNGSAVSRGMPTPTHPEDEDEPDGFDGHALAYELLQAHEIARSAIQDIADANRKLTAAGLSIRAIESRLIESFRASKCESIESNISYRRYAIAPIDGTIRVMTLDYSHTLKAPIAEAFRLPIVAAHAAVDDDGFDDPAEIVACCNR